MVLIRTGVGPRRLAVIGADASAMLADHAALISAVAQGRHKVIAIAPEMRPQDRATAASLGATVETIALEHRGFSPLAAYRTRRDLAALIATLAPHQILVAGPRALGAVGAAAAGVARMVPWFSTPLGETGVSTLLQDKLVRRAFAEQIDTVVVATPEDARLLSAHEIGPIAVLTSIGIDLARVARSPMPDLGGGIVFRCVSPKADADAHAIFHAVARAVAAHVPSARFATGDDASAIMASHVVVHAGVGPGLCAGLVMGLAIGRPVITTDVVGSRETVDACVNGWRVTPGDVDALTDTCLALLRRPEIAPVMARASRLKAERHFDRAVLTRRSLRAIGFEAAADAVAA